MHCFYGVEIRNAKAVTAGEMALSNVRQHRSRVASERDVSVEEGVLRHRMAERGIEDP